MRGKLGRGRPPAPKILSASMRPAHYAREVLYFLNEMNLAHQLQ